MRSALVRCVAPLAPFAFAAAAACASGGRGGGGGGAARPRVYVDTQVVQLQVHSNYVGPLDIYLVSEGVASRLGDVSGPSVQTFVVDPAQFDVTDLRFVAVPIGGYGRASTGRLTVHKGNIVDFRISPILRQSQVFVR